MRTFPNFVRTKKNPASTLKKQSVRPIILGALILWTACAGDAHQDYFVQSQKLFGGGKKKEAVQLLAEGYDIRWEKIGTKIIAKGARGLKASRDTRHFIWQEGSNFTLLDLNSQKKESFDWDYEFDHYELSPAGTSVLFIREPNLDKDPCYINIYQTDSGKTSPSVALPTCLFTNHSLDLPYTMDELRSHLDKGFDSISLDKYFSMSSDESSQVKGTLQTFLIFPLKEGLGVVDPFSKQTLVIADYKEFKSPYSVVPPKYLFLQIPGTAQVLVISGNAGAYYLYMMDFTKRVIARYPITMTLPTIRLSADGDSVLAIKGGAAQERIYKISLYKRKERRFKLAKRDNPFDDDAGNIYYYRDDELYRIPIIGPARRLPMTVRAFFPLGNGQFMIESYADHILTSDLRFNQTLREWDRTLRLYLEE